MSGVIKTGTALFKKITAGQGATERARQTKTSPADAIQFSGCKDNQTSADAFEAVPRFCKLLTSGPSFGGDELGVQGGIDTTTTTKLSFSTCEYTGIVSRQVSAETRIKRKSSHRHQFVIRNLEDSHSGSTTENEGKIDLQIARDKITPFAICVTIAKRLVN
jgi:hypothetical protein